MGNLEPQYSKRDKQIKESKRQKTRESRSEISRCERNLLGVPSSFPRASPESKQ